MPSTQLIHRVAITFTLWFISPLCRFFTKQFSVGCTLVWSVCFTNKTIRYTLAMLVYLSTNCVFHFQCNSFCSTFNMLFVYSLFIYLRFYNREFSVSNCLNILHLNWKYQFLLFSFVFHFYIPQKKSRNDNKFKISSSFSPFGLITHKKIESSRSADDHWSSLNNTKENKN